MYTDDLPAAVRNADLISESVPESLAIKESFWREASRHAPAHTVFTTNTSTLAPSALVDFVDRPQNFLALHFAIGVWDSNIGEVMGHPGTDADVFERVLTFAGEIGLVPIPIRKEQSGYIINSLLVPWCTAALDLLVREVSDYQSIDRTWMITMQSDMGPCGMMDRMGLGVVHHVAQNIEALESAALPRRAVHPERPPWGRERRRLLQLSRSRVRTAGVHLIWRRGSRQSTFSCVTTSGPGPSSSH